MLYTKLWFVLQDAFWGKNIGRARQALVKSILSLAILGGIAVWAQPKWNAWLYPPPPFLAGTCTQNSIVVSGNIGAVAIANARKWAHVEPVIPSQNVFVAYNGERERIEFWLTDGTTLWEIEIVCFIPVKGQPGVYDMKFGEFYTENIEKEYAPRLKELRLRESGDTS